jgi:hypothetical protein
MKLRMGALEEFAARHGGRMLKFGHGRWVLPDRAEVRSDSTFREPSAFASPMT